MNDGQNAYLPPWKQWAKQYGDSARATFRDTIQFEIEAQAVLEKLNPSGERIFDVGCGNGATFTSLAHLGYTPGAAGGCDLLDDFVEIAKGAVPSGEFFAMDISDLQSPGWARIQDFKPTTVIQKRVLCNLSGRKSQRAAIERLCGVLSSGCKIIFIEPILEGLHKLNMLRTVFGLPMLKEPAFNEYLREVDIRNTLEAAAMREISCRDHSSTYYIGSRIIQPFLWPDKEPSHDHPLNAVFRDLPNIEGFGLHWLITAEKP
jgi:SAM-dependent methyltransferase